MMVVIVTMAMIVVIVVVVCFLLFTFIELSLQQVGIALGTEIQYALSDCLGSRPHELNVAESHLLVTVHLKDAGHGDDEQGCQKHAPEC